LSVRRWSRRIVSILIPSVLPRSRCALARARTEVSLTGRHRRVNGSPRGYIVQCSELRQSLRGHEPSTRQRLHAGPPPRSPLNAGRGSRPIGGSPSWPHTSWRGRSGGKTEAVCCAVVA
jgi:hypothetical protein